ncbi:MAG: PAS domain S-box protein [Ignavibacteriae bacterium]|nr:PAS domain S-box protein [Ignavibacteriota bacterium]
MNEKDKTLFPPYRSGYWIAWCFLISGFILTGFTAYIIKLKIDADLKHEFEIECNEIKKSISVRLSAHAQLLRGGASYLMSDEYVSREEWKSYIENGKIDKNLPGIQGMGFSLIVPKVQLTRHIQEIRKEGFPEYKMFPEGNREIYTSVIYLEPFSGKNLRAFGYDMYSEPVRRAAMEQSRDSNTAMLSGKVRLVQEGDEEVQAGTLMYVPVYKEGMPVNTVEERRLAIMGWVYNPYRMNDLMLGILGGWDLQSENRIRLQIYDGDILTTETLLFDTKTGDTVSVKETLNQLLPIDFNGKHWTLNLSGADLHSSYLNFIYAFLICGIVISILIFFLIKSMLNTRIRAVEIAEGLTADIQESEAKFRQLIENSHDIIFTISVDGVFTFVSKSWTNLLGHTIKEVVGQPFQKFVHSDDIPMCTAFLQKIIETGKRQEGIDFRVRHKNGKWLWQTSNVINITNETGIVVALEGIAHDITERKLAEEELHKSEERYRLILKNSFESVYLFDEYSKQIVDANPAFLKLSGYAIEEARTLTLYDIVAEEHSSIDRNITKVLSGTGFSMGERRWKRKDGTIVIVEASASKFIQNGKTVIFISGRDISERKQTEKIIRDNEIYLKKTQTIANLGTYTMDLTSGNWSSSEILDDIFGIETDYDKSGEGWISLIHPEWQKIISDYFHQVISDKKAKFDKEYKIIRNKDKTEHWVHDVGELRLNENGEPVEMIGIIQDITERKQAELAKKESDELFKHVFESSNVSKSITLPNGELNVNKAFYNLLGYTSEELKRTKWQDITHPDDIELTQKNVDRINSGETNEMRFNKRYLHKDGSVIWVDVSSSAYRNEEGKLLFHIATIVDITERKQAEEKLLSQTALLKAQMNSTIDGILVVDKNHKPVLMNNRFVELFNIPQHNMDDEDEAKMLQYVTGLAKNPEQFLEKIKYLYNNPSETSRDEVEFKSGMVLDRYSSPVLDKDGKNYGRIWTLRDITERKHAEEILKTSEEKFKTFFDKSSSGIFLMDMNQKLITVNESFAQMHGYTVEEMYGMDLSEIDIPEENHLIPERIERLLKGETLKFEVKHFHKLGNIIIQDVVTSMINIDNKDYILAFHYDITIRKQAEEVLEKWNSEFRKLSANAHGLIYQFTRRPDGTYYVPIASEGIMDIFGCTPEDVLEDFSPIARVIYPDDMERVISDIEYSANNMTYFTSEFRVQIPGKEIQWVYSNSSPEKLPDGSITWYGFNTDITEQKQVQQELILAKEKAEESDRLKSAFLTNMSHEIRTPMNGILGFSELLKEPHLTGEEQEKFINIIEKSGRRMLNTINDIINISKIEAKQMNLLLSVTNIKDHIESIQIFFRSEAEKKGIQILIKENLQAKDSLVNTDSDKVYGILTNLVSNAIKFTKEGYVEIGCKIKENLLEFYVKDTGAGIEQDQKEIIFERFRQGSEGLSRGYEGSGLGLSISKAFVEILGGKIWVESEAGKGSTFYFTIPYSVENSSSFSHGGLSPRRICDTERAVNSVKLEPEIKKLKILIAEDDETSRMYISLIVKMYSKEILTAQNGIEAVDICRNNPDIDLIMMDIKMPAMDGDEATKQIRLFNKSVVIIAQTAFALKGDRERLIKSGCNDYMTKPVNRNLLGELIIKYFK